MSTRYKAGIGFVQQFIFPFATISLAVILYSRDPSFPSESIIAGYPVGIIFLVVYPLLLRPGSRDGSRDYIELAKGARWGTVAVAAISIPAFLILADVLDQRVLGLGLLAIGFGSIWLPIASAASAFGYALVNEENAEQLSQQAKKSPFNFEGLSSLFLALFLGRGRLLVKSWRATLYVIVPMMFYLSGWIFLSISGSFPVTLFGLVLGLLVPLSSALSFC